MAVVVAARRRSSTEAQLIGLVSPREVWRPKESEGRKELTCLVVVVVPANVAETAAGEVVVDTGVAGNAPQ